LIDIKPFGATGRLLISGKESEVDSSAEAATNVLVKLNDMLKNNSGLQLG